MAALAADAAAGRVSQVSSSTDEGKPRRSALSAWRLRTDTDPSHGRYEGSLNVFRWKCA